MTFIDKIKLKFIPKNLRDPAALDAELQGFSQRLQTAGTVADPALRLDEALRIERDLSWRDTWLRNGIERKATETALTAFTALSFGGMAVGLAAVLALGAAPVACLVAMGAGVTLGLLSLTSKGIVERSLTRRFAPYKAAVENLHEQADGLAQETLDKNAVAIGAAPGFAKTCFNFPQIRDDFMRAFNAAALRGEVQMAVPAPQQTGPQPPLTP